MQLMDTHQKLYYIADSYDERKEGVGLGLPLVSVF